MKIVIEIPDEEYSALQSASYYSFDKYTAYLAMKNGVPLPKGHGRLIDADALNIHDVSPVYGMEVYGVTQDDIEYEPTILEADKRSEK